MALVVIHCIHFLTIVPMQEGIATEHGCEVLSHTLERLLSRSAVAQPVSLSQSTRRDDWNHVQHVGPQINDFLVAPSGTGEARGKSHRSARNRSKLHRLALVPSRALAS